MVGCLSTHFQTNAAAHYSALVSPLLSENCAKADAMLVRFRVLNQHQFYGIWGQHDNSPQTICENDTLKKKNDKHQTLTLEAKSLGDK